MDVPRRLLDAGLGMAAQRPKLSVNADYFELNGKPLLVIGTTNMASDVDREFLAQPNAVQFICSRFFQTSLVAAMPIATPRLGSFRTY